MMYLDPIQVRPQTLDIPPFGHDPQLVDAKAHVRHGLP